MILGELSSRPQPGFDKQGRVIGTAHDFQGWCSLAEGHAGPHAAHPGNVPKPFCGYPVALIGDLTNWQPTGFLNDDKAGTGTMTIEALSINPDPSDGPQLWYTDGHVAYRLDDDDFDQAAVLSRRDIKLIRAVLELARLQIDHLANVQLNKEAEKQGRTITMPPVPVYPQPF